MASSNSKTALCHKDCSQGLHKSHSKSTSISVAETLGSEKKLALEIPCVAVSCKKISVLHGLETSKWSSLISEKRTIGKGRRYFFYSTHNTTDIFSVLDFCFAKFSRPHDYKSKDQLEIHPIHCPHAKTCSCYLSICTSSFQNPNTATFSHTRSHTFT